VPKIFGVSCKGRCWYIVRTFGRFYVHWVYFKVSWYIFPVLVGCTSEKSGNPAGVVNHAIKMGLLPVLIVASDASGGVALG
jgi:hypothetical protein